MTSTALPVAASPNSPWLSLVGLLLYLLPALLDTSHWSGVLSASATRSPFALAPEPLPQSFNATYLMEMRENVRAMFIHAFDSYMTHAFPHDELKPISLTWTDSLSELGNSKGAKNSDYHGVALTLIDSLSTLAIMGNSTMLARAVQLIEKHVSFDVDVRVNLFEVNIRLLGGLLSAHTLMLDPALQLRPLDYNASLLSLAQSLGDRLMPAFDTESGLPSAWVNLKNGVAVDETHDQCTAGVGTLVLEFGVLSHLTGNRSYFEAADGAMRRLFEMRSSLDLFGNTLDVAKVSWTSNLAGIGAGVDSFYEYLAKAAILFDSSLYWSMFDTSYRAAMRHLRNGDWFIEADMNTGQTVHHQFQSLQAFWPGLQTLLGDLHQAEKTYANFYSVWRKYQALPERFLLPQQQVHHTERYYPLRPELMESTYHLYRATRNPVYLQAGVFMYLSIQEHSHVPGGYTSLRDVESKAKEDHMTSFFLAETCKYLFLLFDDEHWLHARAQQRDIKRMHKSQVNPDYLFTTEGHLFPILRALQLEFGDESGRNMSSSITLRHCANEPSSGNHPSWYRAVHAHKKQQLLQQRMAAAISNECDLNENAAVTAPSGSVTSADPSNAAPLFIQLPAGTSPDLMKQLNPMQLQQLLAQLVQQQQQQQPSGVTSPVQTVNDFTISTGQGQFVVERSSTGEIVIVRSLGSLCVEVVDVMPELDEADAQVITRRGVFGYRLELESPSMCNGRTSWNAANAYFGASAPPGVTHHAMDLNSEEEAAALDDVVADEHELISSEADLSFDATPVMQLASDDPEEEMLITASLKMSITRYGCAPLPPGTNYTNHIVLIHRGRCTFVEKILAAEKAGAVGALIINNEDGFFILGHGLREAEPTIAAVMLTKSHGSALATCLKQSVTELMVTMRRVRQGVDWDRMVDEQQSLDNSLNETIDTSLEDADASSEPDSLSSQTEATDHTINVSQTTDNSSLLPAVAVEPTTQQKVMQISGTMSLIRVKSLGGVTIEIEESTPGTFQLRIQG